MEVIAARIRSCIDDILRDKWEYDGVVISDWGSVHTTKESASTSMDIEMSVTPVLTIIIMPDLLLKL